MRGAVLLALLAAFAGCVAVSPSPTGPATAAPADPLEDADPLRIEATGCIGAASSSLPFPPGLGPGDPMPGWPASGMPSAVYLRFAQCQRVHWGPFERPLAFAYEAHDRQAPPEACATAPGQVGSVRVLHAFWVSDPEVAAWANASFGMPARAADVRLDNATVGGVARLAWRWGPPGGEASEVAFAQAAAAAQAGPYLQRLAWADGDGVALLDLQEQRVGERVQAVATLGHMGPDTLYRESGLEAYAGRGEHSTSLGLGGELHRFKDPSCATPA